MVQHVRMRYEPVTMSIKHIRPQGVEKRASRPFSRTLATLVERARVAEDPKFGFQEPRDNLSVSRISKISSFSATVHVC